ncbi:MAG TPA: lysophospholipid acyltransferase family protein [Candidatus Krumholzibacteria bacterium]|nr:lysophospholipid acyltransferase family protein [Candidatus Krumholzibacteria bacterium]
MTTGKKIQHQIEYAAVRGALGLAGALPVTAGQRVGAVLGSVAFDVFRIRRRLSVENIAGALGVSRAEATRIGRRAYRNFGRSLLEFAAFGKLLPADLKALISITGLEHLERVRAEGRGAVFVTGHHGNWELMGLSMSLFGFATDFIVGEQANARVDDVINALRARQGVGLIHRGLALRKVLQALAANRLVALLADQDARRQGIMVEFLGRPASTVRGPALFAIRRGCPIVTGFIHREGTRHRVAINPPIYPPDLPEEEAVRFLTQAHADALATHIHAYPDEYFWPHRRWKTKSL